MWYCKFFSCIVFIKKIRFDFRLKSVININEVFKIFNDVNSIFWFEIKFYFFGGGGVVGGFVILCVVVLFFVIFGFVIVGFVVGMFI